LEREGVSVILVNQLIETIPKHSEKKCAAVAKCHTEVLNYLEAYRQKQTKATGSKGKMQTDREDGLPVNNGGTPDRAADSAKPPACLV
jgi:hypothetical protein